MTAATRPAAATRGGTATVCTPLRLERAALRGAPASLRVLRTGMGPVASAHATARREPGVPVVVAGVGGALDTELFPGDLLVASEVRGGPAAVASPSAPLLVGALRRCGLRARSGPLVSARKVVDGAARKALSRTGAVAVDMESAWLAPAGAPFIALRAIVDTPRHPLWSVGTAARGIRALRALRRAVPALDQWATATGPREVFLAGADPQAVREVARDTELVLVLGSGSHPDSRLLADLAGQAGTPAQLVDEAGAIDLRWLAGIGRIGIITGATAPPQLANDVVACLTGLGPVTVRRTPSVGEDIRITLSREVS